MKRLQLSAFSILLAASAARGQNILWETEVRSQAPTAVVYGDAIPTAGSTYVFAGSAENDLVLAKGGRMARTLWTFRHPFSQKVAAVQKVFTNGAGTNVAIARVGTDEYAVGVNDANAIERFAWKKTALGWGFDPAGNVASIDNTNWNKVTVAGLTSQTPHGLAGSLVDAVLDASGDFVLLRQSAGGYWLTRLRPNLSVAWDSPVASQPDKLVIGNGSLYLLRQSGSGVTAESRNLATGAETGNTPLPAAIALATTRTITTPEGDLVVVSSTSAPVGFVVADVSPSGSLKWTTSQPVIYPPNVLDPSPQCDVGIPATDGETSLFVPINYTDGYGIRVGAFRLDGQSGAVIQPILPAPIGHIVERGGKALIVDGKLAITGTAARPNTSQFCAFEFSGNVPARLAYLVQAPVGYDIQYSYVTPNDHFVFGAVRTGGYTFVSMDPNGVVDWRTEVNLENPNLCCGTAESIGLAGDNLEAMVDRESSKVLARIYLPNGKPTLTKANLLVKNAVVKRSWYVPGGGNIYEATEAGKPIVAKVNAAGKLVWKKGGFFYYQSMVVLSGGDVVVLDANPETFQAEFRRYRGDDGGLVWTMTPPFMYADSIVRMEVDANDHILATEGMWELMWMYIINPDGTLQPDSVSILLEPAMGVRTRNFGSRQYLFANYDAAELVAVDTSTATRKWSAYASGSESSWTAFFDVLDTGQDVFVAGSKDEAWFVDRLDRATGNRLSRWWFGGTRTLPRRGQALGLLSDGSLFVAGISTVSTGRPVNQRLTVMRVQPVANTRP